MNVVKFGIDLNEAARRLSEATVFGKEIMENLGESLRFGFDFPKFCKDNEQVLIEDYTRQAIL